MNTVFELFAEAFASENNLDIATARNLVVWLSNEGALDFRVIAETYAPVASDTFAPVLVA